MAARSATRRSRVAQAAGSGISAPQATRPGNHVNRPDMSSRHIIAALAALALLAACSKGDPSPEPEPETRNVSVAPAETPLRYGDCVEARRRLAVQPDMTVDRVPEPVAMNPRPF